MVKRDLIELRLIFLPQRLMQELLQKQEKEIPQRKVNEQGL